MEVWADVLAPGHHREAIYLLTALVGVIAAVTDLVRRTIPNRLTYPAMMSGLAFGGLSGWPGFAASTVGLLALGLPMVVLFQLGALGGGDVKLVSAFGALLGVEQGAEIVFGGALITGLSLLLMVLQSLAVDLLRPMTFFGRRKSAKHMPNLPVGLAGILMRARGLATRQVPFAPGLAISAVLTCGCGLQVASACLSGGPLLRPW